MFPCRINIFSLHREKKKFFFSTMSGTFFVNIEKYKSKIQVRFYSIYRKVILFNSFERHYVKPRQFFRSPCYTLTRAHKKDLFYDRKEEKRKSLRRRGRIIKERRQREWKKRKVRFTTGMMHTKSDMTFFFFLFKNNKKRFDLMTDITN